MEGCARPGLLAEPDWLWDHRDDPDVLMSTGVFVLSLLGWGHVRAYDASMAEWANRDDTPLVTAER